MRTLVGSMIDPALRSMLGDTITIAPWLSNTTDGYAKPVYGSAVSYAARIEMKAVRYVDAQKKEITAAGRVILSVPSGTTLPSTRDLLSLPSEWAVDSQTILAVLPARDEVGRHHVTLLVG